MSAVVVITGGPGTGKTTIIDQLVAMGHVCYPEISREITQEARRQGIEQLFLEKPLLFSELLLEGRKKQYQNASQEAAPWVFIDRGLPDVLAYMHYIGDSYPPSFEASCRDLKYHKVFVLPPWQDIYVSDEERYETFEQAQLIYDHLQETYADFGYPLVVVPQGTVEARVQFILQALGVATSASI